MTDRNQIINEVEELLGSEGSHDLAEAMVEALQTQGYITFDEHHGYVLAEVDENIWLEILAKADDELAR